MALPELLQCSARRRALHEARSAHAPGVAQLFAMSAGEYLEGWFESDPIKAVLGFDGIVGNYASPYSPGSAYVLLHHVFGEVNGKKGVWGHAIGGMGAITQAMAKSAAARGVDIRVKAGVREVIVENGRAVGVVTEIGRDVPRIRGRVESQSEAALLKLMDPAALPAAFRATHQSLALRLGHVPHERRTVGVAGLHLPAGQAAARITPRESSLRRRSRYMERAYFDARTSGLVEAADRRDADSIDAR